MNILEVLRNIASILVPSRPTLNVTLKDGRKFSYKITDAPAEIVRCMRSDGFTELEIQEMMQGLLAEIRKAQGG